MPRAPLKPCQWPDCGVACSSRYCAAHAQNAARLDSRRRFDQTRLSARKRGYDANHERWRKLVLARDPVCKIGKICGGRALSTEADHITPIEAGGARFDLANGQGACKPCHSWKTATLDSKFLRRGAGGKPHDQGGYFSPK